MKSNYHYLPPNDRQTQLVKGILSLQQQIQADKQKLNALAQQDYVQPIDPKLARQFYGDSIPPQVKIEQKADSAIAPSSKYNKQSPVGQVKQKYTQQNFFNRFQQRDSSLQKKKYRQQLQKQIKQKQAQKKLAKQRMKNNEPVYQQNKLSREQLQKQKRKQRQIKYRQQLKKQIQFQPKKKNKVIDIQFPVPSYNQLIVKEQQKIKKPAANQAIQQKIDWQKIRQLQKQAMSKKKYILRLKNKALISQQQFNQKCTQIQKQLSHLKQNFNKQVNQQPVHQNKQPSIDPYQQFQSQIHQPQIQPPPPIKTHPQSDYLPTMTRLQQIKQPNILTLTQQLVQMNKLWKQHMRIMQQGILQKVSIQQKQMAHKIMMQQLMNANSPKASDKRQQIQRDITQRIRIEQMQQRLRQQQKNLQKKNKEQLLLRQKLHKRQLQIKQNKRQLMNKQQRIKRDEKQSHYKLKSKQRQINKEFYKKRYQVMDQFKKFNFIQDLRHSNLQLPTQTRFYLLSAFDQSAYQQDIKSLPTQITSKPVVIHQSPKIQQSQPFSLIDKFQPLQSYHKQSSRLNTFRQTNQKVQQRLTFAQNQHFQSENQNTNPQVKEQLQQQYQLDSQQRLTHKKSTKQYNQGQQYPNSDKRQSEQFDYQTIQSGRCDTQFYTVRTVNDTKGSIVKSQFIDQSPQLIRKQSIANRLKLQKQQRQKKTQQKNAYPPISPNIRVKTVQIKNQQQFEKQSHSPKMLNQYMMRPPSRKQPLQQQIKQNKQQKKNAEDMKRTSSFGKRTGGSLKKLSQFSKASSLASQFMAEDYQRFGKLPDSKRQIQQQPQYKRKCQPTGLALRRKDLQQQRMKRQLQKRDESLLNPSKEQFLQQFNNIQFNKKKPDQRFLFEKLQQLQHNSLSRDDFPQQDLSLQQLQKLIKQDQHQKNKMQQYSQDFDSYITQSNVRMN